ncbi:helix-turn-helix transcriptional regulator [Pseudomonas sp. 5P_3.1_Bac2]|uniref:helix-turn-helix transcriptional regulator n=1 Tax=Pseudomonas sp. 5P_3.1_Bac2 TaxID=2971617 RepID=UPI0021C9CC5E|nr:AraC family transcriptional regulator [Pseudomonas sp. 5P_3.1_Bac2]MCU1719166.1 AraC family transcriptional regulator [Pseudomonas sp. 5P_3.1_Bac2]
MQAFTSGQLRAAASALGGEVRFAQPVADEHSVLLGTQQVQVLQSGLVLYLSQSQDLLDNHSQNLLLPGITASFLLHGQTELNLGQQRWQLDARKPQQRAMLLNLTDGAVFSRCWQRGREERKVSLSFSREWLAQFIHSSPQCASRFAQFSLAHLDHLPWQPSPVIVQRAQALLSQAQGNGLIQQMQRESFALDLASEILQSVEQPSGGKRLSQHLQQCLVRLKDWLDSGEANQLSIAEMAKRLGSNPVDLQNAFRQRHGSTIAAYLRQVRLQQAYQALRQQHMSVEDAASLAGYEHVSSFSSAFKRQFGYPPSQIR